MAANRFKCLACLKRFTTSRSKARHIREVHGEASHPCPTCGKLFKRADKAANHAVACQEYAEKMINNGSHKTTRKRERSSSPSPSTSTKRRRRETNYIDIDSVEPPEHLLQSLMDDLKECFTVNWPSIRTRAHKSKRVQDIFNYRLDTSLINDLEEQLIEDIFTSQSCCFKINIACGFILRQQESGELRYYHSCQNNGDVLMEPHLVTNLPTFKEFLNIITSKDVLEWTRQQRPNSKWVVEMVTNVTFFVNKILDFPIGSAVNLPPFVLNNVGLYALQKDENNNFTYDDNLCLFRCLALANGEKLHSLNKATGTMFHLYAGPGADKKTFPGVSMQDLTNVEEFFKMNIYVYSLIEQRDNDNNTQTISAAKLIRRSLSKYEKTMYLNLHNLHFSFIHNFSLYAKRFSCKKCGKLWKTRWSTERHEATCEVTVKQEYVGGVYHIKQTVFDKLEEEGIEVPTKNKFFPFRATFDLEAFFNKRDLPSNSKDRTWIAEHRPLSVSVCSNVQGFLEPICFVTEGDSDCLIEKMINYLNIISKASYTILLSKYEHIFEELDTKIELAREAEPDIKNKIHPLEKLKIELECWLKEMPVIGFNSGRYDLNMIKPSLIKCLLQSNTIKYTIKKSNNFMCIYTGSLVFLDISNYLAQGVSYAELLKAYQCTQAKGYFPYEWVDSLDKLHQTKLPQHDSFFSSLHNSNISEEQYQFCLKIWQENDMQNFEDYLKWYNNLDVEPFLEAIEKMSLFYKEKDIDMFKDGISVPGLTLRFLFKTLESDTYFTLFDEKNSDLHRCIKDNIVGGPSIIFTRYHEVGKTTIRKNQKDGNTKLCKSVLGFDANALYLDCLMKDMPTGFHIRRNGPEFKAEVSKRYRRKGLEWLEFEKENAGTRIRHEFNGKEKRVGFRILPVDGWCRETNTVYQFHGCYWHGCVCQENKGKQFNATRRKPMKELREETEKNSDYVRKLGYNLKEMWECEWDSLKTRDSAINSFINARFRKNDVNPRKKMTEKDVLREVMEEKIFGLIECDISVPDCLKEKFAEMQPIFKNTFVSKEDIGAHMKDYADKHGLMSSPRKMLVASYFGSKMLLATPLLQWYIKHGLQVTKIYQVIQYEKEACFKDFGEKVSDARRAGDKDVDKAIVAKSMKLLGNSAYGKTVTNKDVHRNILFAGDDTKATSLVNEPSFRRLNQLEDSLYELEMNMKKIKQDLPLHIGFFVYQYAKLRMLEFYYDFLDVFVDRSDFEYVEMDTDSAYLALSTPTLEDAIRPERKLEFYQSWDKWLPAEACSEHKQDFIDKKMNGQKWETQNQCCKNQKCFDEMTPGLFKIEWEGEGIVGLCSKTYYCFGKETDKVSSKGLSKRQNDLRKEMFLNVLNEMKPGSGQNKGFMVKDNKMYTYRQNKACLSYFYPKRIVCEDGVSTLPIEV